MDSIAAYKIWAPEDAVWTRWAKPVLFAEASTRYISLDAAVDWAPPADGGTMVIVDLPSSRGVAEGIALARMGYRPVPLYNGVAPPKFAQALIDVTEIVDALYQGCFVLSQGNIHSDAPPAFLLDANRMKAPAKLPGSYDNRWCVFAQDMPSASFLRNRGIRRIVVRMETLQEDLRHVLHRYQEQGIGICVSTDREALKTVQVARPSRFRSSLYRFSVIAGLTRNAVGGFGGLVPEPSESSYRHG